MNQDKGETEQNTEEFRKFRELMGFPNIEKSEASLDYRDSLKNTCSDEGKKN